MPDSQQPLHEVVRALLSLRTILHRHTGAWRVCERELWSVYGRQAVEIEFLRHELAVAELAAELDASGLVPDAAMPAPDGIFYGPEDLTKASQLEPETAWPEHPAKLCPHCIQQRKPHRKETPDLSVAARHLLDALKRHYSINHIKAGKTQLMDAAAALMDALDASPAPADERPTCPTCNGRRMVGIDGTLVWCISCAGSGKAR